AAAGPRHGAREARGVDLDGAGVLRVEGASAAEGEVILEGNRVDRQRGRLKREVHAPAHVGAQTAVRDRHAREAEDLVGGSIADLEDAVLALAADRELRGAGAVDQDRGRRSERVRGEADPAGDAEDDTGVRPAPERATVDVGTRVRGLDRIAQRALPG